MPRDEGDAALQYGAFGGMPEYCGARRHERLGGRAGVYLPPPPGPAGGGDRGERRGDRLSPFAREHPRQAVWRPLGRWRGPRSSADPGCQPLSRSRPRAGSRLHQALSGSVERQDLDPERHRAPRDRAALGRGRSAERPSPVLPRSPGADHHPRPRRRDAMIQTIRIGTLLRETVSSPYRNLVTRPTGAAIRNRIQAAIADSDCHTALLDFSDIELLDLSCADEVVAKLLLDGGERGARFVVLSGLREDQHEAIEHVLTTHRLVVAAMPCGEHPAPRLLGWVT